MASGFAHFPKRGYWVHIVSRYLYILLIKLNTTKQRTYIQLSFLISNVKYVHGKIEVKFKKNKLRLNVAYSMDIKLLVFIRISSLWKIFYT